MKTPIIEKNPSYMNSVYAGVVYPFFYLPSIFWGNIVKPVIKIVVALLLMIFAATIGVLSALCRNFILYPIAGVFGRVSLYDAAGLANDQER